MSGQDTPAEPEASEEVVTIFRSRVRPTERVAYVAMATEIDDLAAAAPGFVEAKTFEAADGERVTIVTFTDPGSQRAWRDHPRHRVAQQLGREQYYSEYRIQVCSVQSRTDFVAPDC
jgi:heme-degrading monooxygenase HmoA